MKTLRLGILGLGTVGAGTVSVMQKNQQEISRRAGCQLSVEQIAVKQLTKQRDCEIDASRLTDDPYAVVNHPEVDVVVELIGGDTLAKSLVIAAIKQGKCVVTANKALIAKHGNELFQLARDYGVVIAFEAAVAGGIPIIKALREGLSANTIQQITGIINGTCNYILSEMQQRDVEFATVLAQAQQLGFAEMDPTFDIEGVDVAHKLAILASIAFGMPLEFDKVYQEGITHIEPLDINYAKQLGCYIKHLGIAKKRGDAIELRVQPTLIPEQHTLAHVNGAMNAILVHADAVGETLFYGPGAGALPTASAVVADIIDVARAISIAPENRVPHLAFQANALKQQTILPIEETRSAYYVRLHARDEVGILANVTKILADNHISIESILQKKLDLRDGLIPIIIITHEAKEQDVSHALHAITVLDGVAPGICKLRMDPLLPE